MRLLDAVARSHRPLVLPSGRDSSAPFTVAGPSRFAAQLSGCPLRFVLGDDLAQASAELAFADGARLVGCLDLLRMPAPHLWIEWNDEVHKRVIHATQSNSEFDFEATGRKVGILLRASPDGLSAIGRTFWTDSSVDENAEVSLSPLETHFDLRGEFETGLDCRDALSGGFVDATDWMPEEYKKQVREILKTEGNKGNEGGLECLFLCSLCLLLFKSRVWLRLGRARPLAVPQHGVPADVVDVQVGADHRGHALAGPADRLEVLQEVGGQRAAAQQGARLVVADAGVDHQPHAGRLHQERMDRHLHDLVFIDEIRIQPRRLAQLLRRGLRH